MALSKKHFETIAKHIKASSDLAAFNDSGVNHAAVLRANRYLAEQLAAEFADENERFDRGRFLTACGF